MAGMMGLDGAWDDPTFGPQIFGDPGAGLMFSPTDPNSAVFPWMSNAPSGSVFSPDQSTPTINVLDNMPAFDFGPTAGGDPTGTVNFNNPLGGIWQGITGMLPSGSQGSLIPGAMALTYAASQPNLDLGTLNAVLGQLSGSQNAVVRAATDPLQRNIASGYGDLLQSQALRGIRGSSFGDTDIANYLSTTGNALANAGASASEGSLALQSDLAAKMATLQNQRQQLKNQMFGSAFDVLGRGLNPRGYTSTVNIGGGGGAVPSTPSAGASSGSPLGALLGAGAGAFFGGPMGAGVGMGLGNILGGALGL